MPKPAACQVIPESRARARPSIRSWRGLGVAGALFLAACGDGRIPSAPPEDGPPEADPPPGEAFPQTELSVPTGAQNVAVNGANDAGQVVGTVLLQVGENAFDNFAFYWDETAMVNLGRGGAEDISATGRIVGAGQVEGMDDLVPLVWHRQGEAWVATPLPGDRARGLTSVGSAWGISPSGDQAVGFLFNIGGESTSAVLWRETTPGTWSVTALPSDAQEADALDVNDRGEIIGWTWIPSPFLPVVWTRAGSEWRVTELGLLDSHLEGFANAINSEGDIVGVSTDHEFSYHAVLWSRTGETAWAPPQAVGLPEELSRLGLARVAYAASINDVGEIAGQAVRRSGLGHAIVWSPERGLQDLTPQDLEHSFAAVVNEERQAYGVRAAGSRAVIWTLP